MIRVWRSVRPVIKVYRGSTLQTPVLLSVSPATGGIAGGTVVTLTGYNLTGVTAVVIGGVTVTPSAVTDTSVTFTTPAAMVAGAVSIYVSNPTYSSNTLAAAFTYRLPAPTVVSLSVTSGLAAGGTATVITGTGFVAGCTVTFGGSVAVATFVSGTTLNAVTPAHLAGVVTVTVTNPDMQSGSLPSAFTYIGSITLASISPNYGSTGKVRPVVITGTGFTGTETVTVNGASCTVNSFTSTTLSITIPGPAAATRGIGNVVVTNMSGPTTLTNAYFALDAVYWRDCSRGVTLNTTKIAALADQGGATSVVTSWAQGTGGLQPTFVAVDAALGGHASAQFVKTSSTFLSGGAVQPAGVGANKISICTAATCTNASADTYAALTSKSFSSVYLNLCLDASATGKLQWYCMNSGAGGAAITNAAINDGVGRGFIATHDPSLGSANNKLFVDGTQQTTTGTDTAAFASTTEPLVAGASSNGGTSAFYWNGNQSEEFAEEVIWTTAEISFLMSKSTVGSFGNLNGVGT